MRPTSLVLYTPTLQWAEWAESGALQFHAVAALQWAVGLMFYNPSGLSLKVYCPTLSQLRGGLWAQCSTTTLCSGLGGLDRVEPALLARALHESSVVHPHSAVDGVG